MDLPSSRSGRAPRPHRIYSLTRRLWGFLGYTCSDAPSVGSLHGRRLQLHADRPGCVRGWIGTKPPGVLPKQRKAPLLAQSPRRGLWTGTRPWPLPCVRRRPDRAATALSRHREGIPNACRGDIGFTIRSFCERSAHPSLLRPQRPQARPSLPLLAPLHP